MTINNYCRVVINEKGAMLLEMPDGTHIPGIKLTRLTQSYQDMPFGEMLVKMLVKLDLPTKTEAEAEPETTRDTPETVKPAFLSQYEI